LMLTHARVLGHVFNPLTLYWCHDRSGAPVCVAEGVTLFMGLLAPLQVLLGRYADESDVAVGTLAGGRPRPELDDVVGYFVNTIVLRTDLSGDPTWRELLGRVREVARQAYAHQELPFEKLVAQLSPERDLSRNPLFQVLFALHEEPGAGHLTELYDRKELEGRLGTARFDLALDVTDHAAGAGDLSISVEYATDLFDAGFVRGLGRHFLRVIEQMVSGATARLSELEIVSADELRALAIGNRAEPLPESTTLVRLWDRQVRTTPDAICVVGDGRSLTFAETDARASALARELRAGGVRPESLVGVCLERSVELVVALLGVLKAGGAYVPLDPGYPTDRLQYLLADSGVRLVVADPGHPTSALFGDGVRLVAVDQEPGADPGAAEEAQPHHLAYVIYTSGSTGNPKGVAITHANITGFLEWNQRLCRLTGQDRALLNHSVAFDNSVWEIFQCLVSGAELHLARPTAAYDPEEFLREVAERGITTLNATPSQMRILLESGTDPAPRLGSVRLVFTGAEAVPHDVARRILSSTAPGCQVFNEYGPTEATVTSAFCPITEELLDRHSHRPSVPFGRATDNAHLYVLDPRLRPVAPGCRGELYVGGSAVGRGYLGRPARTAGAYLPDPYAAEPGARMYATGDVVRLLPDGNLVFLGRNDHQVKVRGFRIELGEIEACVRSHPLVTDAVVVVDREAAGGDQLVAYLVPAHDARNVSEDLPRQVRDHLAQRLPAHMVAQGYAVLDALPRTPAGKADRGAVRRIPHGPVRASGPMSDDAPLPPHTAAVRRVWAEVLGLDDVSPYDDFFGLGGQSLTAVRVVARLRAELGVPVDAQSVFAHPTPATLAAALDGVAPSDDEPIPAAATAELSFGQERIWFFEQLNDSVPAYHLPVALGLPGGRVDLTLLQDCLSALVRRHPALRTAVVAVAGRGRTELREPGPVPLRRTEVAEEDLDALVTERIRAPFALDRAPLLRADVLRTPSRDITLLTIHHIACDGASVDLMVRELGELYTELAAGRRPAPAPLPVTYADYAAWQRTRAADADAV
ncbi:amino acid adenylation domain-containing protein, partial [Streptomyces decoyicus]|uniref:amino acid adenylation domain-containing protein n=1 Tax=Streptomyces decoyicus TaxID=249567 RepID=UPI0033A5954E